MLNLLKALNISYFLSLGEKIISEVIFYIFRRKGKMKNKKDLLIILSVQVLTTILVLSFLQWGGFKKVDEKTQSSDTSALNALSARLGQVQVDLNMIKSKLGAGAPATNGR